MDSLSRRRCLLDTGSQVSLWPPSSTTAEFNLSNVCLMAANGTQIRVFGQRKRKIQIGDKFYSFVFLIRHSSVSEANPGAGFRFQASSRASMSFRLLRSFFARLLSDFLAGHRYRVSFCEPRNMGWSASLTSSSPPVRTAFLGDCRRTNWR